MTRRPRTEVTTLEEGLFLYFKEGFGVVNEIR